MSVKSGKPRIKRCDLTELLVEQCACPNHRNIVPDEEVSISVRYQAGSRTVAKFPGTCRGCLVTPIQQGDDIVAHEGGWIPVTCDCYEEIK